jgi:hypothetical protein
MAKNSGKAALKNSFSVTTPAGLERAGGNPTLVSALTSIEHRADRIKERVIKHAKAFEDRWTAREAIDLWKRYLANQAKHPAPPNTVRDIAPEAVMNTAQRQVAARTRLRLAKVNQIKTRMSNALLRSLEKQSLSQRFENVSQTPKQKIANRQAIRNKR